MKVKASTMSEAREHTCTLIVVVAHNCELRQSQWNDVWPRWSILNFKAIHVSALVGFGIYGRAIEQASVWQASSVVCEHLDRTDFIDERGPGVKKPLSEVQCNDVLLGSDRNQ